MGGLPDNGACQKIEKKKRKGRTGETWASMFVGVECRREFGDPRLAGWKCTRGRKHLLSRIESSCRFNKDDTRDIVRLRKPLLSLLFYIYIPPHQFTPDNRKSPLLHFQLPIFPLRSFRCKFPLSNAIFSSAFAFFSPIDAFFCVFFVLFRSTDGKRVRERFFFSSFEIKEEILMHFGYFVSRSSSIERWRKLERWIWHLVLEARSRRRKFFQPSISAFFLLLLVLYF